MQAASRQQHSLTTAAAAAAAAATTTATAGQFNASSVAALAAAQIGVAEGSDTAVRINHRSNHSNH